VSLSYVWKIAASGNALAYFDRKILEMWNRFIKLDIDVQNNALAYFERASMRKTEANQISLSYV